jgi:hypothetical protein
MVGPALALCVDWKAAEDRGMRSQMLRKKLTRP